MFVIKNGVLSRAVICVAAVASEVAVRLVSRYEKNVRRIK